MTVNFTPHPLVAEYLTLVGVAMGIEPSAVVERIVLDTFADNIRKSPAVRPAEIAGQIAQLEAQAEVIFKKAVADCTP